jgi:uncharacterized protein (TIGR02444 family)
MIEIDGAHWRFSLRLYASEGVAPACIHLQDAHGVDVNVLLVALHAGLRNGRAVAAEEIRLLDEAVREAREIMVVPLRSIRRLLKVEPFGPGSEPVRASVKKAELAAEQFEQLLLARQATAFSAGSADAAAICRCVLRHFDPGVSDDRDSPTAAMIATIAASADACGN